MTRESRKKAKFAVLSWTVERRMNFIEDRFFWLGQANRSDVVKRFAVSMSQASSDIARYWSLNPKGVDYDRSAKRYVARSTFRPVLAAPDARRFLGELRLLDIGLISVADTVAGEAPPFAATPLPERRIDAFVLRTILQAIRGKLAVDAMYQSMSRPSPMRRLIEPHALAFDGFRWHARAWDGDSGEYRDFVLGRLSKARLGRAAEHGPQADVAWNTLVELVIAPHPGLTDAQARAIALDYGIAKGSARIPVRGALLFYALKRLGLDLEVGSRPPSIQQIVLLNRGTVQAYMQNPVT